MKSIPVSLEESGWLRCMPSTQATRVGFPLCESETVEGLMKNQSAEAVGLNLSPVQVSLTLRGFNHRAVICAEDRAAEQSRDACPSQVASAQDSDTVRDPKIAPNEGGGP